MADGLGCASCLVLFVCLIGWSLGASHVPYGILQTQKAEYNLSLSSNHRASVRGVAGNRTKLANASYSVTGRRRALLTTTCRVTGNRRGLLPSVNDGGNPHARCVSPDPPTLPTHVPVRVVREVGSHQLPYGVPLEARCPVPHRVS